LNTSTRDRLLEVAEDLFSKNGFYGTSINDVAKQVNVSKQALLHHFSTKESLYAEILKGAAERLITDVHTAKQSSNEPHLQLREFFLTMIHHDNSGLRVVILLMRELLDNRERAHDAKKWFLRPFLDELVEMTNNAQKNGYYQGLHPLVFVYDLLGSVQYFLISKPTLRKLYSESEYVQFEKAFEKHLETRLTNA